MRDVAKSANAAFSQVGVDFPPPIGGLLKRSFDIFGSLVGLVALSPLFLMLALLVKLSDGGSIFYGHKRLGRGERIFPCLKFRTIFDDGERVLTAYLEANPEANAEWKAMSPSRFPSTSKTLETGTAMRLFSSTWRM